MNRFQALVSLPVLFFVASGVNRPSYGCGIALANDFRIVCAARCAIEVRKCTALGNVSISEQRGPYLSISSPYHSAFLVKLYLVSSLALRPVFNAESNAPRPHGTLRAQLADLHRWCSRSHQSKDRLGYRILIRSGLQIASEERVEISDLAVGYWKLEGAVCFESRSDARSIGQNSKETAAWGIAEDNSACLSPFRFPVERTTWPLGTLSNSGSCRRSHENFTLECAD